MPAKERTRLILLQCLGALITIEKGKTEDDRIELHNQGDGDNNKIKNTEKGVYRKANSDLSTCNGIQNKAKQKTEKRKQSLTSITPPPPPNRTARVRGDSERECSLCPPSECAFEGELVR
jgi:hypothetical protein